MGRFVGSSTAAIPSKGNHSSFCTYKKDASAGPAPLHYRQAVRRRELRRVLPGRVRARGTRTGPWKRALLLCAYDVTK